MKILVIIVVDSPLAKDYYDIIKNLKKYKYLEEKDYNEYTNHYMNKKNNKLIYKNKINKISKLL